MAMADTFTLPKHMDLAGYFIGRADTHFGAGRTLEGSEALWGAAGHALIAVALHRGWRYDSHGALKNVARRRDNIPGHPHWLSEFNVAELFHVHFCRGRLTERRIASGRPQVRRFVQRLLAQVDHYG